MEALHKLARQSIQAKVGGLVEFFAVILWEVPESQNWRRNSAGIRGEKILKRLVNICSV